jgi:hypothetical protein
MNGPEALMRSFFTWVAVAFAVASGVAAYMAWRTYDMVTIRSSWAGSGGSGVAQLSFTAGAAAIVAAIMIVGAVISAAVAARTPPTEPVYVPKRPSRSDEVPSILRGPSQVPPRV